MGFEEGAIILNNERGNYHVGETISGRLEFEISDTKSIRGIYVEFIGFCKVHWTTSHSRRENDRTVHYTVVHESYEEYINMMCYLIGSKHGEHKLHAGRHTFPFQFQIPPQCPSSFEGSDGHVRYNIKVTCDRAFKFDQHKTAHIDVIAPIDLNANPYCREPIEMEFEQSYCCWCVSVGNSEVSVKVPASGWCPNQVIPVEVTCNNNSNVEIKSIKFQIKKETVFHAECQPDTHREHDTILEVKKGPIPGRTERNWVLEMELPDMFVPNLGGCRFIDVEYEFKVKIKTGACHEDDEQSRQFVIGTIPLSGFTPQIEPSENKPVSHFQSQPITTQPGNGPYPNGPNQNTPYPNGINQTIPYPGPPPVGINPPTNSPYPGANPPYPGANPPYPGANPPYPGANPPYPGANPPHPGSNPPYPTTPSNNPYPGNTYPNQNPPYPNYTGPPNTSPYPAPNVSTNAPYPTNMGPDVPNTGSSPYPPTTSPYPPTASPYPPTTSPYPPATSPYPPAPPVTGTTLLKTGNYGFSAHGSEKEAAMPLLPPSAAVPRPASPYAAASAPMPSTPDDEGKKLAELPKNSTPYNPEFAETSDK